MKKIVFFLLFPLWLYSQSDENLIKSFVFVKPDSLCLRILHPSKEPENMRRGECNVDRGSNFDGDIIVTSGSKMIVEGEIGFVEGSKLIVERGGYLVIDGGTLSGCCNKMWKGIEQWGTASATQNPVDQGWVEIINGGTIENALVGIKTCKISVDPTEGEVVDLNYTGGIVQASEAVFRNNRFAVIFYDYSSSSASYFDDCDFVLNDNYICEDDPGYFVRLNSMHGIDFTYCRFLNESSNNCYGKGIYGFNSGFRVEGKCVSGSPCTDWDNGEFTNLNRGIYATSGGTSYFPEIAHTEFTGNHRSVFFSAMKLGSIKNCTITTGPMCAGGSYGVYLDRSTGYTIEENVFYQGNDAGIGMVINKSGGAPNQIYRNEFDGLKFGIIAQNNNRAIDGTGLELKCNTYDNMYWDKLVLWDGPVMSQEMGIAESQGSPGSNPENMAGNLFDDHGTPDDDYDDILNEANQVIYYYPQNTTDSDVEPVDYTQSTVTLDWENVDPEWSFENGCPPSEGSGGGGRDGMLGKIAGAEQKIDSTENLLNVLIDGGNTEATQTEVDNSMPPETMRVYNDLMNKSPYLSDTVVSTAIEKEDVLPGAMIRDIMVANPSTAKSEALMNKLDERWDPLPEYMKAQILAGRSIVSIREETESHLAAFKMEKAKAFNSLARYYLNDTVNPEASIDSLAVLLENENSLTSKYRLAMMSLEHGAWGEGLSILNAIPSQFELSAAESEAHTKITAYYTLLSGLKQQGKSILEVDSVHITALAEMETSKAGMASVYARNVLLALETIGYDEPILMPDLLKSSTRQFEYEELISKVSEVPEAIRVKPSPARDYTIIEYELEIENDALIEVYDVAGNLKYSKNVMNKQDQLTVDTQTWKAGIYVVSLKINGKLIESVKFMVID
ncbi:MAG: T9SS type A sorting domain-containing protein [Bacteroidales bacterium]